MTAFGGIVRRMTAPSCPSVSDALHAMVQGSPRARDLSGWLLLAERLTHSSDPVDAVTHAPRRPGVWRPLQVIAHGFETLLDRPGGRTRRPSRERPGARLRAVDALGAALVTRIGASRDVAPAARAALRAGGHRTWAAAQPFLTALERTQALAWLNETDQGGAPRWHGLVRQGATDLVAAVLETRVVDVHAVDGAGRTALFHVPHAALLKVLLLAGARAEHQAHDGSLACDVWAAAGLIRSTWQALDRTWHAHTQHQAGLPDGPARAERLLANGLAVLPWDTVNAVASRLRDPLPTLHGHSPLAVLMRGHRRRADTSPAPVSVAPETLAWALEHSDLDGSDADFPGVSAGLMAALTPQVFGWDKPRHPAGTRAALYAQTPEAARPLVEAWGVMHHAWAAGRASPEDQQRWRARWLALVLSWSQASAAARQHLVAFLATPDVLDPHQRAPLMPTWWGWSPAAPAVLGVDVAEALLVGPTADEHPLAAWPGAPLWLAVALNRSGVLPGEAPAGRQVDLPHDGGVFTLDATYFHARPATLDWVEQALAQGVVPDTGLMTRFKEAAVLQRLRAERPAMARLLDAWTVHTQLPAGEPRTRRRF